MKTKLAAGVVLTVTFLSGFLCYPVANLLGKSAVSKITAWDSTDISSWPREFNVVSIDSSFDDAKQSAYTFKASGNSQRPLIVSLHTWSGDYRQNDPLAQFALENNWNYVHPDFRGANNKPAACASDAVLSDIDDAIDWGVSQLNADPERVVIVGASGGGHAACAHFLRSKKNVLQYFCWVPITDLNAWYHQGRARNNRYPSDLLKVIDSTVPDSKQLAKRSPLFMPDLGHQKSIHLFAGIHDGYTGSVPIDHTIRFWNRLCSERNASDKLIDVEDILSLVTRSLSTSVQSIGDRTVYFTESANFGSVTIFDGEHEMLTDVCAQLLQKTLDE